MGDLETHYKICLILKPEENLNGNLLATSDTNLSLVHAHVIP